MSDITKARALELAKNLSDSLKHEQETEAAAKQARADRDAVARAAAAEIDGKVIFETSTGEFYYVAGVKGGTVGFRKALDTQLAKARAEGSGVSFYKLPVATTLSAKA